MSSFSEKISSLVNISDHIDTRDASERIKSAIWFRGPNVWILAFSIIIASVGLNVNSTAVVIGAMLISPLMGPIIGVGLAVGTTDIDLLKRAAENLLVMVLISLGVSTLYFLVTPLNLVNPTELEARTSPTIYDVMIALFGGLAGILENSRKDRGTVLSGVAIATALMPPLCTAGYGLSHGNWNYFGGAMYLFLINTVFIVLATVVMVKYLQFDVVRSDEKRTRRAVRISTVLLIAFLVPSVLSAIQLVRNTNFDRKVQAFISENKTLGRSYIYDHHTIEDHTKVEVYMAGEPLSDTEKELMMASARRLGLEEGQVILMDRSFGMELDDQYEAMVNDLYDRADREITRRDVRIKELEKELEEIRSREPSYRQIAREVRFKYPDVEDLTIGRGAAVRTDSLAMTPCISVVAQTRYPMSGENVDELSNWMRIRMDDSTVVVRNIFREAAPAPKKAAAKTTSKTAAKKK